jgi:hypothetical protein
MIFSVDQLLDTDWASHQPTNWQKMLLKGAVRKHEFQAFAACYRYLKDVDRVEQVLEHLDVRYDDDYYHLILWDDDALEIIGAYRFIPAAEQLARRGLEGIYSDSLFHYDEHMLPIINQGLELGCRWRPLVVLIQHRCPKYWLNSPAIITATIYDGSNICWRTLAPLFPRSISNTPRCASRAACSLSISAAIPISTTVSMDWCWSISPA